MDKVPDHDLDKTCPLDNTANSGLHVPSISTNSMPKASSVSQTNSINGKLSEISSLKTTINETCAAMREDDLVSQSSVLIQPSYVLDSINSSGLSDDENLNVQSEVSHDVTLKSASALSNNLSQLSQSSYVLDPMNSSDLSDDENLSKQSEVSHDVTLKSASALSNNLSQLSQSSYVLDPMNSSGLSDDENLSKQSEVSQDVTLKSPSALSNNLSQLSQSSYGEYSSDHYWSPICPQPSVSTSTQMQSPMDQHLYEPQQEVPLTTNMPHYPDSDVSNGKQI